MSLPSVFGLPHLSEDAVAAFADGVLSPAAAARAEKHCTECQECADAVRGQREAAMMLRSAVAPPLPSGLMDRLAGLPMSAPLPPPSSGLPTTMAPDGTAVFIAHRTSGRREQRAGERHPGDQRPEAHAFAGPLLRRGALPVGLLAAAGAVVAAGALGTHSSTVYGPTGRTGPAANIVGVTQTDTSAPAPAPSRPSAGSSRPDSVRPDRSSSTP